MMLKVDLNIIKDEIPEESFVKLSFPFPFCKNSLLKIIK